VAETFPDFMMFLLNIGSLSIRPSRGLNHNFALIEIAERIQAREFAHVRDMTLLSTYDIRWFCEGTNRVGNPSLMMKS
jgi:hypothetical protein